MTREVLKLALETLESSRVFVMSRERVKQPEGADWYDNRITEIKAALAQSEQDTLAGMSEINRTIAYSAAAKLQELGYKWDFKNEVFVPLYTSPPKRQPLTEEQMANSFFHNVGKPLHSTTYEQYTGYVRSIEAAHGIRDKT